MCLQQSWAPLSSGRYLNCVQPVFFQLTLCRYWCFPSLFHPWSYEIFEICWFWLWNTSPQDTHYLFMGLIPRSSWTWKRTQGFHLAKLPICTGAQLPLLPVTGACPGFPVFHLPEPLDLYSGKDFVLTLVIVSIWCTEYAASSSHMTAFQTRPRPPCLCSSSGEELAHSSTVPRVIPFWNLSPSLPTTLLHSANLFHLQQKV